MGCDAFARTLIWTVWCQNSTGDLWQLVSAEEGKRHQLIPVCCPILYQGMEEGGLGDQSVTISVREGAGILMAIMVLHKSLYLTSVVLCSQKTPCKLLGCCLDCS